jgi:hypothetical protein
MESLKQEALNVISKMPDTAEFDDIMYRLYFTDKVRKGRVAIHRDGGQYLLKIRIKVKSCYNGLSLREMILYDFRKSLQRIHPLQALDRLGLFFML